MDYKGHSIREAVHRIVEVGLGDDLVSGKATLQALNARATQILAEKAEEMRAQQREKLQR
jgi:hypothetical protein